MLFLEFALPVLFWIAAFTAGVGVWVIDRRARRKGDDPAHPAPRPVGGTPLDARETTPRPMPLREP